VERGRPRPRTLQVVESSDAVDCQRPNRPLRTLNFATHLTGWPRRLVRLFFGPPSPAVSEHLVFRRIPDLEIIHDRIVRHDFANCHRKRNNLPKTKCHHRHCIGVAGIPVRDNLPSRPISTVSRDDLPFFERRRVARRVKQSVVGKPTVGSAVAIRKPESIQRNWRRDLFFLQCHTEVLLDILARRIAIQDAIFVARRREN